MTKPCALLRALQIALFCAAASSAAAAAAEFVAVIVGNAAPAIGFDEQTLRDVFLKRIVVDDAGRALVPLNLPPGSPAREAFGAALWRVQPIDQQRYWNERYFHGITPPYVLRSEEAMLRFVAETAGAVGYVASCHVDARVQVVARLPVPPRQLAALHETCAR